MFERIIPLIGKENLNKIKSKKVLVVGLGGVGGSAVETLVRSGITNITLIDNDTFEESNLNRQSLATTKTFGDKKVEGATRRLLDINPNLKITTYPIFLDETNINNLETYDYIIDACDSPKTKILLMQYALNHNCQIISAMGTGKRLDPRCLKISTLNKTYNDPLAKVMRHLAKEHNLNMNKISVVFSEELPLNNDKVIASMAFVPNTAGILMAYFVINDIIKEQNDVE